MPKSKRLTVASTLILIIIVSGVACQEQQVPHVSQCNLCEKCYLNNEQLPPGFVKTAPPVRLMGRRRGLQEGLRSEPILRRVRGAEQEEQQSDDTLQWVRRRLQEEQRSSPGDDIISLDLGSEYDPKTAIALGEAVRARLYATRTGTPLGSVTRAAAATGQATPTAAATTTTTTTVATNPAASSSSSSSDTSPTLTAGELTPQMFRPGGSDTTVKTTLPKCSHCYGCNTHLSSMASEAKFFDRVFRNEKGASPSWLFQATTNRTASGKAVVKVYCMPIPKREGGKVPTCAPDLIAQNMKTLLALEKLSEECGFTELTPKVWVEKVDAVVPELGYHIRWHGLWMDFAEGVSLENFLNKGEPNRLPPSIILDVLMNKLNKTSVVNSAIFDLLTSQCDRHSQNIFINEAGRLMLIDNEVALQSRWRNCGFDSILVPGTQKQEIIRLSNEFVLKLVTPEQARKGVADPQLLLDYRCYLPGGADKIGTVHYPEQVKQCLARISKMSVKEVWEHYGFDEELPAKNLLTRATDMITKGYEYAFKYGEPRNADPKRYRVQPKCCNVIWKDNRYSCGHPWEPKFELPIGDMTTGRNWTKDRPDTGTYQGGTHLDDTPSG